jgi:para-nitrobenzyl esterase
VSAPVVETSNGRVSGAVESGVNAFRGIPYGASTGGVGRFRPPSPPRRWTGVLETTTLGPTAPQPVIELSNVLPAELTALRREGAVELPAQGEDCLVLNLWTPGLDSGGRPVMVWLHGGPFTTGTGSTVNGARLAARGDVVVVSLNHRLGMLGYLYLDRLAPDRYSGSGVVGMLDIVAALEWVRDNVGAFGGDPSNVTIFGCSGGGMKASTLLAMPAAHGLFHKAIIESGPYVRGVETDRASEVAERVLAELDLTPKRLDELADVPLDRLMQVQGTVLRGLESGVLGTDGGLNEAGPRKFLVGVARGGTLWDLGPVVDGVALPRHPFDPLASPLAADVPLIIGNNKDESSTWLLLYPKVDEVTFDDVLEVARAIRGDQAPELMALYRRTRPSASPTDLLDSVVSTDAMWLDLVHIAERKVAGGQASVFMYQFAYESDVLGGRLKAAHGMEVPFVFDDVESAAMAGKRPERLEVARVMSEAWVAFARTGDPNHPDLPKWTTYSPSDRSRMIFDTQCRLEPDPTELREGLDKLRIAFAH